jgi:hypothetical protein
MPDMKRYWKFTLFFVLAGCGSFNNSFNTYPHPTPVSKEVEEDTTTNGIEDALVLSPGPKGNPTEFKKDSPMCPLYKFKELDKTPPLPMAELLAAGNNLNEIEKIERKHIDVLRAYIVNMKKGLMLNRHQYLLLCQEAAGQVTGK